MTKSQNTQRQFDPQTPILPIGSFAQSLNIHPRTLRIYDKEKILCPKRSIKNRRYYSIDDFEKAKLIQFLTKNLALNLSGVKIMLALLQQNKVKIEDSISYINKIARIANIDLSVQEENITKTSKRGRKIKTQEG